MCIRDSSHSQPVHVVSILFGAFISGIGGILIVHVLNRRSSKTTTESQQSLSNPAEAAPLLVANTTEAAPLLRSSQDVLKAAAAAAEMQEREMKLSHANQFYSALPGFLKLVLAEIDRQSQTLLDHRPVCIKEPVEISQRPDLLDLEVVNWLKKSNWCCKRTWHEGWTSEVITRHGIPKYYPGWYELEITPLPEV